MEWRSWFFALRIFGDSWCKPAGDGWQCGGRCQMPDIRSPSLLRLSQSQIEEAATQSASSDADFFRDLYDVTGVPRSWRRFLTRVCDLLDASCGAIAKHATNQDLDQLVAMFVRGAPHEAEPQEANQLQARRAHAVLPILPPSVMERLMGVSILSTGIERLNSECLFSSVGMRHLLIARNSGDSDKITYIAIGRTPHQPPFEQPDEGLLEKLLPHFQRAVQLEGLVATLSANLKASAVVLDLIPTGVLILDGRGACVAMNDAAHKALDADGAALRHITVNSLEVRGAERHANHRAPDPHIIDLPNQATGQRLLAVIWDMPDDPPDRRRKLAFLINPEQKHNIEIDLKTLERMYGLTETEARVAALLAKSDTVAEIADQLGNTVHTIRTHLRHIFEKTGTVRQVDLVHLLLRSLIALQTPTEPHQGKGSR